MTERLRMMGVLAHPDDEALGFGGALTRAADEGIETYLVMGTRGERGRYFDVEPRPEPELVGKVREKELLDSARVLGVREVHFLDYLDKELDQAPYREVIDKIARQYRSIRPQVVVTFAPDGGYGHPDHIAISQFATAACVRAADPSFQTEDPPHSVSKLYYLAWTPGVWAAYQQAFKTLTVEVDGTTRQAVPWPEWAITTEIDTTKYWPTVWEAVCCHKTQLTIYKQLAELPEEYHRDLWGRQQLYRAFSTVNNGRKRETDLFEGIRKQ